MDRWEVDERVGLLLSLRRMKSGESAAGLALKVGVSERTLRRWERGKVAHRLGDLCELLKALGCSHREFLDEAVPSLGRACRQTWELQDEVNILRDEMGEPALEFKTWPESDLIAPDPLGL